MAPAIFRSANNPLEPEMGSATAFKSVEPHPGMTNRAVPFPMSLQPNISNCVRGSGAGARGDPNLDNNAPQPLTQISRIKSLTNECSASTNKLNEEKLTIEGGTISISNVYSQG